MVPLSTIDSPTMAAQVSVWLSASCPTWSSFSVRRSAPYLGLHLGPGAYAEIFDGALFNFYRAAEALRRQGAPLSATVSLYNSDVLSRLGYICQFAPLPLHVLRHERHLHCKLLRLPGSALSSASAHAMGQWGLPQLGSLEVFGAASQWRAARRTLDWATPWLHYLGLVADLLPIITIFNGKFHDDRFWDGPPYALNLKEAAEGWQGHARYSAAGAALMAWQPAPLERNFQKFASVVLREQLHPRSPIWEKIISTRLARLGVAIPPSLSEVLVEIQQLTAAARTPIAAQVWRTLTVSWTTARRCHSHLHLESRCVFGCLEAQDEARHYLVACPLLWAVAQRAAEQIIGALSWYSPGNIAQRLLLENPCPFTLLVLAIGCRVYHAVLASRGRPSLQDRPYDLTTYSAKVLASTLCALLARPW